MGMRYRLHRNDLPSKPDLTFPKLRKIIFVYGCFWHGHDCMRGARLPKENAEYWANKIKRNQERDATVQKTLRGMGGDVLYDWECELKDRMTVKERLRLFLFAP